MSTSLVEMHIYMEWARGQPESIADCLKQTDTNKKSDKHITQEAKHTYCMITKMMSAGIIGGEVDF